MAEPITWQPEAWARYYNTGVDLGAVVGTPGLEDAGFGERLARPRARFVQSARRGFFLTAAEPLRRDPVQLGQELSGVPLTSDAAAISGSRRRRVRRTRTGTHVQLEQLVRGAPVVGADTHVHHDEQGVYAVTGRPLGDIEARDPGPAVASDDAEALAVCLERFGLAEQPYATRVQQVVFPLLDGAIWAYKVAFVVLEHAADVRVYLRADTLELLLSYNVTSAARAYVFRVNPRQNPRPEDAGLLGLERPGNLLRGPALDVSSASGARLDRADGDFRVDPADPAFDEPNAYHHLWRGIEYFKAVAGPDLMSTAPFAPMVALVNDAKSPGNAYYYPSKRELRFGHFGSRSSARSAALIYHELGHAVTDAICKLGRSYVEDGESRGLSEGYSDYFAASLLNDPRYGDYVADSDHGDRNCADPGLRFPAEFSGEPHVTGAVWAAVLWAVRTSAGAAVTDRLAIESVEYLHQLSTFEDARAALHEADGRLHGGANRGLIDEQFDARRSNV